MADVEGEQLRLVQSLFGVPTRQILGITDLDADRLTQTLPIVPEIVRRSLSIAHAGGWFIGVLENVHSGADGEQSEIDPYEAGADASAPFPATVPDGWDLWILGISGIRSAESGGLTRAVMRLDPRDTALGWGRDDAGAPVTAVSPPIVLATFTGLATDVSTIVKAPMLGANGETMFYPRIRMPRPGATLLFDSESAAAAEFQAVFLMGLFPESLGQDVVS